MKSRSSAVLLSAPLRPSHSCQSFHFPWKVVLNGKYHRSSQVKYLSSKLQSYCAPLRRFLFSLLPTAPPAQSSPLCSSFQVRNLELPFSYLSKGTGTILRIYLQKSRFDDLEGATERESLIPHLRHVLCWVFPEIRFATRALAARAFNPAVLYAALAPSMKGPFCSPGPRRLMVHN